MRENIYRVKSKSFALEIINLCNRLKENKEYNISNQLFRSGTSIGANICEAECSSSTKDFINKLTISLKECNESTYWLELLHESGYITTIEFNHYYDLAIELRRMLLSSINTNKSKLTSHNSQLEEEI